MPSKRPTLISPSERAVRRAARAICRETCAQMGEPACFDTAREYDMRWPPETCDAPGCIVLATVALVSYLNRNYQP